MHTTASRPEAPDASRLEPAGRARRRRDPPQGPAAFHGRRRPGASTRNVKATLSPNDVARQAGVSVATLRRWQRDGLIPRADGEWSAAAAAQARIVARLRARGHSLPEIRAATESGRLAFGYLEDLFPLPQEDMTLAEAARETGLQPALVERIFTAVGFNSTASERLTADDVQFLRYVAAVLAAGFPLVAFLQLVRVYGQALAQISDAEVRLFHLYV